MTNKIAIITPDGEEVRDFTPEEQAQHELDIANANKNILVDGNNITKYGIDEEYEIAKAEQDAKDNLKASAKAKLMAGEALTEDEANVMIGG